MVIASLSLKNMVCGGWATRGPISLTLRTDVIMIRNATFIDRCSREQVASGSTGALVKPLRTRFRSHAGVGLPISGYM